MSEYMFGIVRDVLSIPAVKARSKIAKEHGAEFIYTGRVIGQNCTGWYTCPNLGHPFDRNREARVLEAVNALEHSARLDKDREKARARRSIEIRAIAKRSPPWEDS